MNEKNVKITLGTYGTAPSQITFCVIELPEQEKKKWVELLFEKQWLKTLLTWGRKHF